MSTNDFVAFHPDDSKWKVNDGYNTESQSFYLVLPNGAFFQTQVTYAKIGFVPVIRQSVFSSFEKQTRITGGICYNFNADGMKMTSDVSSIERFEDGGVHVEMKPGSGAEGYFRLSPGEYQDKAMRLPNDETIMQITPSTPMKVTGKLKVPELKDHEFDLEGAIGFFGNTTFKGRFDAGITQANVVAFISPEHIVVAVTHHPKNSDTVRQVYHYHNGSLTCSVAEIKVESTYVYPSTQHKVPASLSVALTVDNNPATLSVSGLKPQQCIEALDLLPYMAKIVIQNFVPNPCFYFYHHTGTITSGSTVIPGVVFVESDYF